MRKILTALFGFALFSQAQAEYITVTPASGGGGTTGPGIITACGSSDKQVLFTDGVTCAGNAGLTFTKGSGTLNATILQQNSVALGTAAFQNTGTSGANIPFLNGTNTWSGDQSIASANSLNWNGDTKLSRFGVGTLGLSDSTTATTLQVYNTTDSMTSPTNYERGVFDWTTNANVLTIGTQKGGTGSTRNVEFVIGGVNKLDFGVTTAGLWTLTGSTQINNNLFAATFLGVGTPSTSFAFSATDSSNTIVLNSNSANTARINVPANNTFQFGQADAAVAVAQTLRVQSVVAGTAAANGANLTVIGSLPTGTGTSGDIIFQTGIKTGSGTTQGTPTTALTLKGETQAAVVAGTLSATLANVATTSAVCYNTGSGLFTYDGTIGTCTVSAMRFKNPVMDLAVERNALDALHPAVWTYKDASMGLGERVGLYADDVERMDPRCVSYASDGQLQNYDERCVIAYLVAEIKSLKARINR